MARLIAPSCYWDAGETTSTAGVGVSFVPQLLIAMGGEYSCGVAREVPFAANRLTVMSYDPTPARGTSIEPKDWAGRQVCGNTELLTVAVTVAAPAAAQVTNAPALSWICQSTRRSGRHEP